MKRQDEAHTPEVGWFLHCAVVAAMSCGSGCDVPVAGEAVVIVQPNNGREPRAAGTWGPAGAVYVASSEWIARGTPTLNRTEAPPDDIAFSWESIAWAGGIRSLHSIPGCAFADGLISAVDVDIVAASPINNLVLGGLGMVDALHSSPAYASAAVTGFGRLVLYRTGDFGALDGPTAQCMVLSEEDAPTGIPVLPKNKGVDATSIVLVRTAGRHEVWATYNTAGKEPDGGTTNRLVRMEVDSNGTMLPATIKVQRLRNPGEAIIPVPGGGGKPAEEHWAPYCKKPAPVKKCQQPIPGVGCIPVVEGGALEDRGRSRLYSALNGSVYQVFNSGPRPNLCDATKAYTRHIWIERLASANGDPPFMQCIDESEMTVATAEGYGDVGDPDIVFDPVSDTLAVTYSSMGDAGKPYSHRKVVLATAKSANLSTWSKDLIWGDSANGGDQGQPNIALAADPYSADSRDRGTFYTTWYEGYPDPLGDNFVQRYARGYFFLNGIWLPRSQPFPLSEPLPAIEHGKYFGKDTCQSPRGVLEYQGITQYPTSGHWFAAWGHSDDFVATDLTMRVWYNAWIHTSP